MPVSMMTINKKSSPIFKSLLLSFLGLNWILISIANDAKCLGSSFNILHHFFGLYTILSGTSCAKVFCINHEESVGSKWYIIWMKVWSLFFPAKADINSSSVASALFQWSHDSLIIVSNILESGEHKEATLFLRLPFQIISLDLSSF